ncbi:hypothetical protein RFI_12330, partial [Reticulomyxa filosa]
QQQQQQQELREQPPPQLQLQLQENVSQIQTRMTIQSQDFSTIVSTPTRQLGSGKKFRTLSPRWAGYLTIIKSTIIPDTILEKHEKFYFCLDGLPRGTNNKTNEPDDIKNRHGEPLIPSLFFFENEEDFKALVRETVNVSTRHVAFQKTFARFCRGVFQLDTRAVDKDQAKCLEKLKKLLPREKNLFPPLLKRELAKPEQLFYCIGLQDHTVLKTPNQYVRDKWLEKINYLVEKRVKPYVRHKVATVEDELD